MKLTVNSKETEVKDGCTIAELSTFLALPEKGIAIAVNNRMVPRIEWEKCVLHPNDSLVVSSGFVMHLYIVKCIGGASDDEFFS